MDNQQQQTPDQFAGPDPTRHAQEMMLRMASDMRSKGHVHQALGMYKQLLDDYPDTQASQAAANAMVDLAGYLEQNGQPQMALHVYQILEQYQ